MNDYKFKITELIHRYLTGIIREEEVQELQKWVDNSPTNKAFFEKVCRRDNIVYNYKEYKKNNPSEAYECFSKRVGIKTKSIYTWLKYAALLFIPLGISLFLLVSYHRVSTTNSTLVDILPGEAKARLTLANGQSLSLQSGDEQDIIIKEGIKIKNFGNGITYPNIHNNQEAIQYNTLETPRGGEYRIVLSDGSVVMLNSATQLKYPVAFDQGKREVYLSGEAYFHIEKAPDRPFYVIADGIRIRVYGTSFNVNTHDRDYIRTVLVEGALGIKAESENQEYRMIPSQMGEFHRENKSIEIKTVDTEPYIAWKDGFFVFENQSMEQIMRTLSLWYDVDIFFKDEQLKSLHFTGHLKRYDKINTILKAISGAIGVTFLIEERTISISESKIPTGIGVPAGKC